MKLGKVWVAITISALFFGAIVDLHSTWQFESGYHDEGNRLAAYLWERYGFRALIIGKTISFLVLCLAIFLLKRLVRLNDSDDNVRRSIYLLAKYLVPSVSCTWLLAGISNYLLS